MADTILQPPAPEEEFIAVFSSSNHDAEMEAMAVHGVLDASGVPALLVGPQVLPTLEFQVQVPANRLVEAQRLIADAQAAGPQAAAEAELAGERGGSIIE